LFKNSSTEEKNKIEGENWREE
jgi:hypothetical protein